MTFKLEIRLNSWYPQALKWFNLSSHIFAAKSKFNKWDSISLKKIMIVGGGEMGVGVYQPFHIRC